MPIFTRTHAVIAMATIFALSACATTPPVVWNKDGATKAEYDKDDRACNYDAKLVFNANINSPLKARYLGEETWTACMQARGWVKG